MGTVGTFYDVPGTRRLQEGDEEEFLHQEIDQNHSRNLGAKVDPRRDRYAAETFIPRKSLVEIDLTEI